MYYTVVSCSAAFLIRYICLGRTHDIFRNFEGGDGETNIVGCKMKCAWGVKGMVRIGVRGLRAYFAVMPVYVFSENLK